MITFVFLTIIALVLYVTVRHYSVNYSFLEYLITPTRIIFWVIFAVFITLVIINIIKAIKKG